MCVDIWGSRKMDVHFPSSGIIWFTTVKSWFIVKVHQMFTMTYYLIRLMIATWTTVRISFGNMRW